MCHTESNPLCCWLQGGCLQARVALCVLCSTTTALEHQLAWQHYKHITGQTSPNASHALLCRLQYCAVQAVIQI